MSRRPVVAPALGVLGVVCCGYYNGMWSADHFAAQARRQERQGRRDEARTSWAAAAVKAESVVSHHPHGRWADAALVLQGEGLAKSGACTRAAAPLARALASVENPALRERAALAAAECSLAARNAVAAERVLGPVATSPRRARASRAAYLLGRVAEQRGDFAGAARAYARSSDREAGPARARVLLAAGRTQAALACIDTLAGREGEFGEEVWAPLLAAVGDGAGVAEASRALDRVLAAGRLRTGARARLLLGDADRLFAAESLAAADGRYEQVTALVPDSSQAQVARVRRLRVAAAQTATLGELRSVTGQLDAWTRDGLVSAALAESQALQRLAQSVLDLADSPDPLPFRSAELARDSLHASRLASNLFQAFARARPVSLFAPKALLAAAALEPARRDSMIAVLDAAYAASPYARAMRGEPSPAYGAAEDSLARALGVTVEQPSPRVPAFAAAPVPGPRGPPLDPRASPEPSRARDGGDWRRPSPVQP